MNMDQKKKNNSSVASFIFKGRNTPNEGELLYVDSFGSNGKNGYVLNVLNDMYVNRLDEEINRLLKKKEKISCYEPIAFNLEQSKDWLGKDQ
jgi:hypothetical protein